MTVIAYRDGCIAADTLVQTNKLKVGHTSKIVKSKQGYLAGGAGSLIEVQQFLSMVSEGKINELNDYPFKDIEAILISPTGEVTLFDGGDSVTNEIKFKAPFYACGIGAELAIGAMEMGGLAEDAVNVAIKYNTGCGGKVEVLELQD